MKNCPSVLLVGIIASSLLPNGNSLPHEGYQAEDVIKDFPPGYGGEWNSRKPWGDLPFKGVESKGWGPDYVSRQAWEEQEKIRHGGFLPEVKGVMAGYDMKRGEWDRKEWGQEGWNQKDWDRKYLDRKDWDRKEWQEKDLGRGDWDRKDWDKKDQWKRPPLESWKKVPGFDMFKDAMKHGEESLVSFIH